MKLPYFKFFPTDFEMDDKVRMMDLAQVGLYLKCLNAQWIDGSISADLEELSCSIRVKSSLVKKHWPMISKCFIEGNESGRLINPRLERERTGAITKSVKAAGAAQVRHGKDGCDANAMRTHSERITRKDANAHANASETHHHARLSYELLSSEKTTTPEKATTTLESAVSITAQRIHERHPAVRRCGIGELQDKLRAIVRRVKSTERLDVLHFVDTQHAAWCATEDWMKENGQYAKGLDNWLAPTKRRWENNPPDQMLDETQMMIAESWAAMEAKNGD